ncbi:MAG TPA: winged helix-turn-helix transcriptional regulator [Candidatus Avanaerovorax faecigallinarum]|nr:winged helix-turn-helix transcriptional regulator [Candidatus Avanaerovorax faecigallinarum]
MHYLKAGQYTYLAGEINALYHEAAVKMGISDSVQNIMYVLCEKDGRCMQSEVSRLTGMSRQTINSAIRNLEKEGIVYLEQGKGRNTILCLTEKGKEFAAEKILPIYKAENKIWNEWTTEEQEQYLTLTEKYRDGLKKYLIDIL